MNEAANSQRVAAYRLIKSLLAAMLESIPRASHASLNLIEARGTQVEVSRMQREVESAYSQRSGATHERWPTLDWALFLPKLRGGCCQLIYVASLGISPMQDCYQAVGISRFLVFPVAGRSAGLLGAVLTKWSDIDRPPTGAALEDLVARGTRVAGQIGSVLDICEQAAACLAVPHPEGSDRCIA